MQSSRARESLAPNQAKVPVNFDNESIMLVIRGKLITPITKFPLVDPCDKNIRRLMATVLD